MASPPALAATKGETCQRVCRSYQARFPDIPALSSQAFISSLLSDASNEFEPFLLVDVRTQSERRISMLEGAITLTDFKQGIAQHSPDVSIITYCTVGYRSGLEARRLRNQFGLEGRIYSLDGIVSYTHAVSMIDQQQLQDVRSETKDSTSCKPSSAATSTRVPKIINPHTNEETRTIHTFGATWDNLCDGFHGVHFSIPVLMIQLFRVCNLVAVRTIQELPYRLRSCYKS